MNTKTAISKTADGEILAQRLLTVGASDGTFATAVDGTKPLLAVSTEVDTDDGSVVDGFIDQIPFVVYGGNVAYGDQLTATAGGKAIKATTGDYIIGYAMTSGVLDDQGEILIARGVAK